LGGNRGTPWRVRLNLMLTMLLGGLWHGAALNFVFWGAWHGLLLILAHAKGNDAPASFGERMRRRLVCFHVVVFSWLLFRTSTWGQLTTFVWRLLSFTGGRALHPIYYAVLGLAFLAHFTPKEWAEWGLVSWQRVPAPVQG